MNRGIIAKAARESLVPTIVLGALLGAVEFGFGLALSTYHEQIAANIKNMPMLQMFAKAILGADVGGELAIGPELFQSVGWVHPIVLAALLAHAVIVCTRVPAGEVDRGTIDVLLSLPVSRLSIFVSETLVWLTALGVIIALAYGGNWLGMEMGKPGVRPPFDRTLIVLVNLAALSWAVGGFAMLASAASNRRGPAMTVVFVLLVLTLVVNYLAQFWAPLKNWVFLSLLHYHRPPAALRDGLWPTQDLIVLGVVGLAAWISAAIVFSRRDLTTV